ncbi:MAG: tRNA pseudouridine(55) synthase TruB [Bacteroidota bacterium]
MHQNLEALSNAGYYCDEDGKIFLLNKPLQWTSFNVVKKVRCLFNLRKVGHTGTLDPRAEGLLIVCTEKKTKLVSEFELMEKEYRGTMILGACTKSFDAETEVYERHSIEEISEEKIHSVMHTFLGQQEQLPPMYSALKHQGKSLYEFARNGEEIKREPRSISISVFEMLNIELPSVAFRVVCSKGTYIRSLVNDVGNMLGCGAYLSSLTRTRIGNFSLANAISVDGLEPLAKQYATPRIKKSVM